ncbi:NACHT domain-containing protein [Streptomyces triticagri]|uniref:NACHT domain-containing protein n=1 Tax=Streptomyces triticagri TaxID=2293568 RepID=A0A372M6P4_9ACTN|nr:SUMF1/EgtB/PvdO family nonheme iron enzyme [Streptomyces triticagri]RFU86604.1 NACHT domain-containing protein [Streptomyces triticagri]
MSAPVDERLDRLRAELDEHTRIAAHLDMDLRRPLRSIADGYPENAISLIGNLTERLLKELWRHHDIEGDPSGRALNDLIKRCQPHIRSSPVVNALDDIRRLRNRSAHDGYEVAEEDGLLAVRRLVDVLAWFTSTGSAALAGGEPHLAPEVARRCEFLSGLYVTLGHRIAKRFVLSPDTVYQLFCRESGMRLEYVELVLSTDAEELRTVLNRTDGVLLRTRLPKLTRFVVLDEASEALTDLLGQDFRCVEYDGFVSTVMDIDAHLATGDRPQPPVSVQALTAHVLRPDERTGDLRVDPADDAARLLAQLARGSANVLVTGRPGSGKSTLLKGLARAPVGRRFRFYFDLSLKPRDESFGEYVGRLLAPCMTTDRSRAYDLFLYLIRSGSALCILDAVDETVADRSPAGLLRLFADLAPVLSAESTVVMSSRVSFLADSPQIRSLLDRGATPSEQLVEQMYAGGVDPARLPHFHLIRLGGPGRTPLEARLAAGQEERTELDILLDRSTRGVLEDAGAAHLLPRVREGFGRAFLAGQTRFSLVDLYRMLGAEAFADGCLEPTALLLAPLLRPAGTECFALVHSAYQELFAARYLADLTEPSPVPEPCLTDLVRAFRARLPQRPSDDCVLTPGTHLVGPAERLLLRPVRFDRHTVTVARYRRFLAALHPDGTSPWDHPDQPAHVTHLPPADRLRDPQYFTDPAFDDHPAVCVTWWSAYAFAAYEGKRLPTSLEWEAAARGRDGRLFPWGDRTEAPPVNCADTWVGRPLVTYQAWRTEFVGDAMRRARATAVHAHPENRSPYGVVGMAGNVWEWTSSSVDGPGTAVICGGSYDNPLRAVQASSKSQYRKPGTSNAVGFRCVEELEAPV